MQLKAPSIWFPIFITCSLCACSPSFQDIDEFPSNIVGKWVYETGDPELDGCTTPWITISPRKIVIPEKCIETEESSKVFFLVESVYIETPAFSNEIDKYHVRTEGPHVVVDPISESSSAGIYLQFWLTNEHARVRKIGTFTQSY